MPTITLAYSPCPNDTFIFDAMVHHKIDTEGLEFQVTLADVEQLNRLAFKGNIHLTKLSYNAHAQLAQHYKLLHAGSALGNNCGPLLIAKKQYPHHQIPQLKVAIPGINTTANFLLTYTFPELHDKHEIIFSDIENAVLDDRVNAGLIIHENRFTYHQKGLLKLIDLGKHWESKTGLPIPLGGIAVNNQLPQSLQQKLNRIMRRSVEFALQNPQESLPYVQQHAQEMNPDVMQQHIQLYVNQYTIDLGEKGKKAIQLMYQTIEQQTQKNILQYDIFVA